MTVGHGRRWRDRDVWGEWPLGSIKKKRKKRTLSTFWLSRVLHLGSSSSTWGSYSSCSCWSARQAVHLFISHTVCDLMMTKSSSLFPHMVFFCFVSVVPIFRLFIACQSSSTSSTSTSSSVITFCGLCASSSPSADWSPSQPPPDRALSKIIPWPSNVNQLDTQTLPHSTLADYLCSLCEVGVPWHFTSRGNNNKNTVEWAS